MTFSGFNALFYTLAFVVPGFVLHSTLSVFVPRRAEEPQVSLLRFLYLSCLNYAIWSWLIYLIYRSDFFTAHPVRTAAAWSVIILLGPTLLGVILGNLKQRDVIRNALQTIGFTPIHVIPTAWDYKFSKLESPSWLLVTLRDGNVVAGLFANKSFASDDPRERDLYIESVCKISGGAPWQPIKRSDGILLKGDQIKHIEFFFY